MFILKTISGETIKITEQEHKNILLAETDIITLASGITIRKNMISIIYPESKADEVENRKLQQTGILHDGTRVIRHFGEWIVAEDTYPDDDGKYQRIKLDKEYYPEVAADCIATEQEYKQIKAGKDYYQLTGYKKPEPRTSTKEFTQLLE